MQFDGAARGRRHAEACRPDAIYTVTEVYPDHVVLDGNHPLAGIALRLDVTVRDVREASDEEIEAGSVGQPAFTVLNDAPAAHVAALRPPRHQASRPAASAHGAGAPCPRPSSPAPCR